MRREGYLKKVASACRSFLTLEVSICRGVIQIERTLYALDASWRDNFPIFEEFGKVTMAFPKHSSRLGWDRECLLEQDSELAAVEVAYRPRLMRECFRLLDSIEKTLQKEFPARQSDGSDQAALES
jgi:hypothetical protein